ncbi:hypothetical protein D623_10025028 [Myotis brandtii]|uniref:Uncharacterized protein n=1 Tax=Myotis brandtii TaxID=109478 RepID=S7NKS5_MYOBR|nr:hypothetical protein D623_10025028 [Myotis brandtii]
MLQMLWHFLSSFFPRAGCQGSTEGNGNEVRGTPAPARGDPMSSFLGKQDGRAEATEKRPTILLVVGPAEQFPKNRLTAVCPFGGVGSLRVKVCLDSARLGRVNLVSGDVSPDLYTASCAI